MRPLLHFVPRTGWMGGPAALCRFQGRWHLFYLTGPSRPVQDAGPSAPEQTTDVSTPPPETVLWGHAVSLDLVHWKDEPQPGEPGQDSRRQDAAADAAGESGGLLGCVLTVDAEGRPCDGDSAAAMRIYVAGMCLTCTDGVHVAGQARILDAPREKHQKAGPTRTTGLSDDSDRQCRDPQVDLSHQGQAVMVMGTSLPDSAVPLEHLAGRSDVPDEVRPDGRHGWFARGPHRIAGEDAPTAQERGRHPAITAFINLDPRLDDHSWVPAGALLTDVGIGQAGPAVCPDLFLLDGASVALAGLDDYRDGMGGRFRPVRWYVGDLTDRQRVNTVPAPRLLVRSAGWLDFGPDLSGVRTFRHDGRRILVGRIADTFGVTGGDGKDKAAQGPVCVPSLPRELHVRDGRLFQHPVTEVYAYGLGDILTQTTVPDLSDSPDHMRIHLDIPANAYYADLRFVDPDRYSDFSLTLGAWTRPGAQTRAEAEEDERQRLGLTNTFEDGLARLTTDGIQPLASVDAVSQVRRVRRVEVFYDRGIAEIFLNDGQAAGTIIVPDPRTGQGALEALLPKGAQLTVRTLSGRSPDRLWQE
jgi:beta-fructofuranosidase